MSDLYVNFPSHWNQNEQRISESFTKSLSLKVDSPPQLHLNARSLRFNLRDHDSSSSQSTQSNHNVTANASPNSQDQCLSSESGQEVSCGKNFGQAKPIYLMGHHPEASYSTGQVDYGQTMTCMPYPSGDPYYNGLLTAYGTSSVILPHMMGMTSTRVPLPLDISEGEPIYVNAKQYHGILRRRQSRAKMEAQNKLIKNRKPYLHESRHLHALKRVRGSGGRFLSTKKQQQSDSTSNGNRSISGSNAFIQNRNHNMVFEPLQSHAGGGSSNAGLFEQPESGFLGLSSSHTGSAMQRDGGFMYKNNPNQPQASVVR